MKNTILIGPVTKHNISTVDYIVKQYSHFHDIKLTSFGGSGLINKNINYCDYMSFSNIIIEDLNQINFDKIEKAFVLDSNYYETDKFKSELIKKCEHNGIAIYQNQNEEAFEMDDYLYNNRKYIKNEKIAISVIGTYFIERVHSVGIILKDALSHLGYKTVNYSYDCNSFILGNNKTPIFRSELMTSKSLNDLTNALNIFFNTAISDDTDIIIVESDDDLIRLLDVDRGHKIFHDIVDSAIEFDYLVTLIPRFLLNEEVLSIINNHVLKKYQMKIGAVVVVDLIDSFNTEASYYYENRFVPSIENSFEHYYFDDDILIIDYKDEKLSEVISANFVSRME